MERIGKEVERRLTRAGGEGASALAEVTSAWPRVVGEAISRNAWPLRTGRDGTLHVATSSATWAFELDRMSEEIAARLREALGEAAPGTIRFRVGPVPEPGPEASEGVKEERGSPPETPPEVAAEASAAASAIEDPELRALVARAARASLLGARSDRRFW